MKKILIFILTVALCLIPTTLAFSADELISETFDSWTNPYVAEGWTAVSVGGWGGELNQIYEAAQVITAGPADAVCYRSIFKDFEVEGGKEYSVTYESRGTEFKVWLQFWSEEDKLLLAVKGLSYAHSYFDNFYMQWAPYEVIDYWGTKRPTHTTVKAPPLAKRMRLVFQVPPPLDHVSEVHLRNVVLRLRDSEAKRRWDYWGHVWYDYPKITGPFITRNTEFLNGVNKQFGTYTLGSLPGEYNIKPVGGSSQGISCGGNSFEENKHIYRDFKVAAGEKYKLSVDVISNSTNFLGTRDPSPVRIWIQYDDKDGRVLSTHGIDGTQAGIKDNEWTTVTVPGPNGEPYTTAPAGTDHARIILQVMGGIAGGTIFDNVSFTRYEN